MLMMQRAARSRPGRFVLGSLVLLAAGALLWFFTAGRDTTPPPSDVHSRDASQAGANIASVTPAPRDNLPVPTAPNTSTRAVTTPAWPASLRDSEPDGEVTLDAGGRVRPSIELRRLFDYFLSAIGELDLASIRALLLQHVAGLHGAGIAADVAALFDRYVAYQQSLAAMNAPPAEPLRERLARVHELRRRLLDAATADAFFADEERYTEYTLDRRDLLGDATLDEATRSQRLGELEQQLSPAQRAQMQQANSALLVDEQNRQFDALQLSAQQRQAEREALFGAEAAQRLAQVDAERDAWNARIASYRQARDAIRGDARLDPQRREQALADLRARSFDEAERRRVGSLEAIGAL